MRGSVIRIKKGVGRDYQFYSSGQVLSTESAEAASLNDPE